ncbi:MAG: ORF6N domain-containing protein [Ignavibacteriales bacterium]|nr:ORF6N domain-containing protein [Ignavibacteriales bacterium]
MNKMEEPKNKIIVFDAASIQRKIYTIRDSQVMLDSDLAEFYGIETRAFNQAVKRNILRFPADFMFQLTNEEFQNWKSQIVTTNDKALISQIVISKEKRGGRQKLPYVFTEQGVAMLSGVLRSKTAVKMSIQIISAFVAMRRFIINNAQMFQRIDTVEKRQLKHEMETDEKFENLLNGLQNKDLVPKQGIFFEGQIFDAYKFVSSLIRKAERSILLIDNYIDETVLDLLTKKKKNVVVTILTGKPNKSLMLDEKKFNAQYPHIIIKEFNKAHDRFLIIDNKDVYHLGASLKDLGRKWFAFSKLDKSALELLENIKRL